MQNVNLISFDTFQSVDLRVAQILSAEMAMGTRTPSCILRLDLGPLGIRVSIGQYALVPTDQLIGKKVIVCCNLGPRRIGKYESEVLVLGVPHPDSPPGQAQALPIIADQHSSLGDKVF
jgi:tRNA-binding protein